MKSTRTSDSPKPDRARCRRCASSGEGHTRRTGRDECGCVLRRERTQRVSPAGASSAGPCSVAVQIYGFNASMQKIDEIAELVYRSLVAFADAH